MSVLNLDDIRALYDADTDACRPIQAVAYYPGFEKTEPTVISTREDGVVIQVDEKTTFLPFIMLHFNGGLGKYVEPMFERPHSYSQQKGWLGKKDATVPPNQWNFLMSASTPGDPEATFLDGTCLWHPKDWGAGSPRKFYVLKTL